MKTFPFFLFLMGLNLSANAQQFHLEPEVWNYGFVVRSSASLANGDFVIAGSTGSTAYVSRYSSSGVHNWSRKTGSFPSEFNGVTISPSGEIVAVGKRGLSALVAKFDSDGNTLWTKNLSITDTTLILHAVVISSSGDIYAVGEKYKGSQFRELLVALDANGNVTIQKELTASSSGFYARRVFLEAGHIFVFGEGRNFGKAPSVAKYTMAGSLVSFTTFGGWGPDDSFSDAVLHQGEFVVSYVNANDGMIWLVKISSSLAIVGQRVALTPGNMSDSWALSQVKLLSASDGLYVTGRIDSVSGYSCAGIIKLDPTLQPIWGKKAMFGRPPTSAPALELVSGNLAWFKNHNNTTLGSTSGTRMSFISPLGNQTTSSVYCDPFAMLAVQAQTDLSPFPVVTHQRGERNLILGVGSTSFSAYQPVCTSCGAMLPVEMLSFTGEQINRTVELYWATGSEQGNDHFDIERSLDGFDWEMIGQVDGAGNSYTLREYEFADRNPGDGMNYYRLRQVDIDGSENLSEVVAIDFVVVNRELMLYPNPIQSGQTLGGTDGQAFEVVNLQGQIVFVSSGLDIVLPDLPTGTYIVRITATGTTGRVIVN